MAFELDSVVPWGRNLDEYRQMFLLSDSDLKKRIAGFGDGPACFNAEATRLGMNVTSYDPIYQFKKEQLEKRIKEVRDIVMKQMAENRDSYVWNRIKNLEELEKIRMDAMSVFLEDYEDGKTEGRYICHELPNRISCADSTYDIGLSSHFLLMYTSLGYEFHIAAIDEMLRVSKEVRIFPIVDLDANESEMISDVIRHYENNYDVKILETDYEFQKNARKLLIIKNPGTNVPGCA